MSKRLLDLMLEHDVQWPNGAVCAAQGKDGEVIFTKSDAKHVSRGHVGWTDDMGGWMDLAGIKAAIATDQATAVITRGAYEATKAKKTPTEPASDSKKHSHYHKDVSHLQSIDVYRVLALFGVNDPALQHAVKKLLCGGQRGSKGYSQDLSEAIDSIQRAIQMHEEDEHAST